MGGINGIGIPDLIIAQNAIQNHCAVYSLDNHFKMMKNAINLKLDIKKFNRTIRSTQTAITGAHMCITLSMKFSSAVLIRSACLEYAL
jgi:hypothetical protein